jgi:hypothetical protein
MTSFVMLDSDVIAVCNKVGSDTDFDYLIQYQMGGLKPDGIKSYL